VQDEGGKDKLEVQPLVAQSNPAETEFDPDGKKQKVSKNARADIERMTTTEMMHRFGVGHRTARNWKGHCSTTT
jgi:hypothetical protein